MDDKLFDAHAKTYNECLAANTKWVSNDIGYFAEHKVLQMKHHMSASPMRVLDYGCGIGRNIPYLAKHFPKALFSGCDISVGSLEVAEKENPNAKFFVSGKGIHVGQFDLIIVSNVFHHIEPEERGQVVDELKQLLTPDGNLFVFEHNPYNPLTRYLVKRIPFDEDAQLVTAHVLAKLFHMRGYELIRSKYTMFFPQWASKLSPIEPYLGWLPMGAQYFIQVKKG